MSSLTDYENAVTSFSSTNTVGRSSVKARWERKVLSQSSASGSTPADNGPNGPNGPNTPCSSSSSKKSYGDRFIPNRSGMTCLQGKLLDCGGGCAGGYGVATTAEESRSKSALPANEVSDDDDDGDGGGGKDRCATTAVQPYIAALAGALDLDVPLGGGAASDDNNSRILSFRDKAPLPRSDAAAADNLKVLYSQSIGGYCGTGRGGSNRSAPSLVSRHVPSAPSRILDAPDLLDDYYLNLLSWSDTNVLAVALAQTVYLWNAGTGEIDELMSFEGGGGSSGSNTSAAADTYVSSLSWVQEGGQHLAIGTSTGQTLLYDASTSKQLRSMDGHADRVSSMSWNAHVLSTGGRDAAVVNHDVRAQGHAQSRLKGHGAGEVCGLSWSPDGKTLASGGNDNRLCLWDASASATNQKARYTLTDHQAAVKALAWSPHDRNLLASGGGTADRCIKFWSGSTGALLNSVDTGSQVCALQWSRHEREVLSSHGYARNQLCLWKYPTMKKVKELNGHTARVLHMAQSPDGTCVVSAAADETLRFWNVFEAPKNTGGKRSAGVQIGSKNKKMMKSMHIR